MFQSMRFNIANDELHRQVFLQLIIQDERSRFELTVYASCEVTDGSQ